MALVRLFVSSIIGLLKKLCTDFYEIFWSGWSVSQEEVIRFWDQLPQLSTG